MWGIVCNVLWDFLFCSSSLSFWCYAISTSIFVWIYVFTNYCFSSVEIVSTVCCLLLIGFDGIHLVTLTVFNILYRNDSLHVIFHCLFNDLGQWIRMRFVPWACFFYSSFLRFCIIARLLVVRARKDFHEHLALSWRCHGQADHV
jgi:hypothetical protein